MLTILIFVNLLIILQEEFADQYDDETVEMRDFTVRTNFLPESFKQYTDATHMKFAIWQQIQTKIKDCKAANLLPHDLDSTIVELNFGIKNFDVLNELK